MSSGKRKSVLKHYIPLFILPGFNIIQTERLNCKTALSSGGRELLFIFIVVCAEEVVFRKAIPCVLKKCTGLQIGYRCLTEAAIFALAHLLNLAKEPAGTVIAQVILAFGVGTVFAVLVKLNNNITPCILVHFLLNITGSATSNIRLPLYITGIWVMLSAACTAYGYFIFKKRIVYCMDE